VKFSPGFETIRRDSTNVCQVLSWPAILADAAQKIKCLHPAAADFHELPRPCSRCALSGFIQMREKPYMPTAQQCYRLRRNFLVCRAQHCQRGDCFFFSFNQKEIE
jgi:hypothetical protein